LSIIRGVNILGAKVKKIPLKGIRGIIVFVVIVVAAVAVFKGLP